MRISITITVILVLRTAVAYIGDIEDLDMLRQYIGDSMLVEIEEEFYVLTWWAAADLDDDGEEEVVLRYFFGNCEGLPDDWDSGHFTILGPGENGYSREGGCAVESSYNCQPEARVQQVIPGGGPELLEEAPCGPQSQCMNILTFSEDYEIYAFTSSAMGISIDPDGTVSVGQRDDYTDPLANGWTATYTWNDSAYQLNSVEFYGTAYQGVEGALLRYYNTLNVCLQEEELHPAYRLLSSGFQSETGFREFSTGLRNIADFDVAIIDNVVENNEVARAIVYQEFCETFTEDMGYMEEEVGIIICCRDYWRLVLEDGQWKPDGYTREWLEYRDYIDIFSDNQF